MHLLTTEPAPGSIECGAIGGDIWLPEGVPVPACATCGRAMALYFQLEVRPDFGLPFHAGSRLNAFCCPEHDDLALEQYSDQDRAVQATYGQQVHVHYSLMLVPPGLPLRHHGSEPRLLRRALQALPAREETEDHEYLGRRGSCNASKIGGLPSWFNYAVDLPCPCGGRLAFLCQVSEVDAGDWFLHGPRRVDHHWFLNGNQTFLMACDRQCSVFSIIPVCDN